MSYESADYINQFDKNLPAPTDSISEGDIHLRMIKDVLQQSFPNVNNAVNCIHTGPTEPQLHTAGTVWFDTSSGLIKIRDASNLTWLNMAHGAADGVGSTLKMEWHDLGTWVGRLSTGVMETVFTFDFSPLSPTSKLIIDMTGTAKCAGYGKNQNFWLRFYDSTNDVALTDDYPVIGFNHVDDIGNFEIQSGFSFRKYLSVHEPTMFTVEIQGLVDHLDTEAGQRLEMIQVSVLEIE